MESCSVPPGFRFHPTDEELVGYYLRKKVASQKIDLDVIRDIDLYRIEPWDLQERCRIGYEEQNEWYFFSHKDKKYPTGTRTNRATMAGFWKATGRDKAVFAKSKLIGMRKTLVFYKGRAPNGQKTDWILHEYRLESEDRAPPLEEGWVVCRAFKKRTTNGQVVKSPRGCFGDESTTRGCFNGQCDYVSNQQELLFAQSLICKEEAEPHEQFIQLPQLESPPLQSGAAENENLNTSHQEGEEARRFNKKKKAVADWRDLDKFVASQLMSHNENIHYQLEGPFYDGNSSMNDEMDMGLLLLQSRREEEKRLNGFLNSSSECDICVFDK